MLPEENVAKKIFAEKFSSSKFFFRQKSFLEFKYNLQITLEVEILHLG